MTEEFDLFGNKIEKNKLLRDEFIEPPFSVIDTKSGNWQNRKRDWLALGIKSELGRDAECLPSSFGGELDEKGLDKYGRKPMSGISIFDPALCELLYKWFCPNGGEILDPFAGGSVRGIVANFLGFKYTGVDIRQEQIDSNRVQGLEILPVNNQPNWYVGDSNEVLNDFSKEFDFIFSCPPYADLEVYSDIMGDISNMEYKDFLIAYKSIIEKSCKLLKKDAYACFVVGEVRDSKGNYYSFVPDTIKAFTDCGMKFYNEAIILNSLGTAMLRAANCMKNKKLVKVHQNVLIFKKY